MTTPPDPSQGGSPDPTGIQVVSMDDFEALADSVDARFAALQGQVDALGKPVQPPPATGTPKLWGTADQSGFKGNGVMSNAHRTYFGLSTQQNGFNPALMKAQLAADKARGAWSYVSIGPGHDTAAYPATIDTAKASQYVDALNANKGKVVMLGRHEPGNPENPKGTPAQFVTWQTMLLQYYKQAIPGLLTGICLMAWSIRNGASDAKAYMPPDNLVDEFCIDGYAHVVGADASKLYANAVIWAKQIKKPLVIAEHGQEQVLGAPAQIAWLQSVFALMKGEPAVKGALYWNGGHLNPPQGHNYHLLPPAMTVFAQLSKDPLISPKATAAL